MRLDFAMLARAATAAEGQLFIHGGAMRAMTLPGFPTAIPLSIAARLVAEPEELGSTHGLSVSGIGPNEVEPFFTSPVLDFVLEADDVDQDDAEISVLVGITIGLVPLPTPGAYHFLLVLDGDPLVTLPFYARPTAEPS